MLARPVAMTGMLGAAVGVPYAIHNPPQDWPGWSSPPAASAPADPAAAPGPVATAQPEVPGPQYPTAGAYGSPMPLEGGGFYPVEQVLRMDVTKDWVYRNWPRKSTGLAEPGLFGVRVPLVTGTGMNDLAGSLSYYFNAAGQVDKIRFRGTTADTNRVIALAQRQYGLAWQPPRTPGEQLLQSREGGKVVGQLRTFPEPVLWNTKPHGSYGVDLEFNRPGSGHYVTNDTLKLQVPPDTTAAAAAPAEAAKAERPPAPAATSPQLQNAKRPDFRWPN